MKHLVVTVDDAWTRSLASASSAGATARRPHRGAKTKEIKQSSD